MGRKRKKISPYLQRHRQAMKKQRAVEQAITRLDSPPSPIPAPPPTPLETSSPHMERFDDWRDE